MADDNISSFTINEKLDEKLKSIKCKDLNLSEVVRKFPTLSLGFSASLSDTNIFFSIPHPLHYSSFHFVLNTKSQEFEYMSFGYAP